MADPACSMEYPVLPEAATREESEAATSGFETLVSFRRSQIDSAEAARRAAGQVALVGGTTVERAMLGSLDEDISRIHDAGIPSFMTSHPFYDGEGPSILKTIHDFDAMKGTDVAEVDDSSVPQEVKDRIYKPATDKMRQQAATYNTYQNLIIIPIDIAPAPRNPAVDVQAIRSMFFGPLGTMTISAYFAVNSHYKFVLREGWIANYVRLSELSFDMSKANLIREALAWSNVDWGRFLGADDTVTQDEATVVLIPPFGNPGGQTAGHDISFVWNKKEIRVKGMIAGFDSKAASDFDFAVDPLRFNEGVAIHELSHALFWLPDRYGTGAEHGGRDYVGGYDIMSNTGSRKMYNAHDRMKIGWSDPRIIHINQRPRQTYKLRAAEQFPNSSVVVYTDYAPDEYWVIENRNKDADAWGVDTGFPQSGLCIWWVDMSNDNVVLINQHCANLKPLEQPQPELPLDPLFNGDGGTREAFLFPQYGNGGLFLKNISGAGQNMSFEI